MKEVCSLLSLLQYVRRMPSLHIIGSSGAKVTLIFLMKSVLGLLHCRTEKKFKISQCVTRQENNFLPYSNDLPFLMENNANSMLGFSDKMEKSSFITDVMV